MGRPRTPLISRREVLAAALSLIDEEGLEALSIRRLGVELKIHGSSLYHHFSDKKSIIVGATELALQFARTPDPDAYSWPEWILQNCRSARDALLRHPNLIPVMLSYAPLGIGTSMLESSAALLEAEGVPVDFIVPLLESTEMLVISSAMYSGRTDTLGGVALSHHDHPTLLRATKKQTRAEVDIFEDSCRAMIESWQARIAAAIAVRG